VTEHTVGALAPFVSVIIPTYQREEDLCETLRGLFAQEYPRYEVLVVDQTPVHTPTTTTFLHEAEQAGRIHRIFVPTPNLPGARNVGARAANGEILIFCDDDILVSPGFIGAHVDGFISGDVGIIAGGLIVPARPDLGIPGQPTAHFLRDGRCTMGFGRGEAAFVETAPGGNMAVLRRVFDEVGGFDAGFVGNAFREESDFCFRARALGHKIRFEPNAAVVHVDAATGGCAAGTLPQQQRDRHYNETRFFLRYFPRRDFPRFLWRIRPRLLHPGTLGIALRSRRLADLFAPHLGVLAGIRGFRRAHRSP
jgi:GT2 family glycosyltransferase